MQARWSISLVAVGAALAFACGSTDDSGLGSSSGGNSGSGGSAGASGGSGGGATGGSAGSGGTATGGTAGTATGGSAGTATGGSAGTGPLDCSGLEAAYADALEKAKVCENGPDPVQPCSQKVDNELACPCETFVNPGNGDAIEQLNKLGEQWKSEQCAKNVACPEIACPVPASAICSSSGGKGSHCVDVSVGGN